MKKIILLGLILVVGHINAAVSLSSAQPIAFSVWLKGSNQAQFQQVLKDIYTQGNPHYHDYLTPQKYDALFAPSRANVDAVKNFFESKGFTYLYTPANNAYVHFSGTVGQVETIFNIQLQSTETANGRQVYFNNQAPELNSIIAPLISGVTGLDNKPMTPSVLTSVGPNPIDYTPQQLQSAYAVNQLPIPNNINQTISIVDAFGSPTVMNDLKTYEANYHLNSACITAGNCLTVLNQKGQTSPLPPANPFGIPWLLETALDVESVHAMLPSAKINLYQSDDDSSDNLYAALNTIISQPQGSTVVSCSWGATETANNPEDAILEQAAAEGLTLLFATGDQSYQSGIEYPASSPWVTAVGGTTLHLNTNNTYKSETAWIASNELGSAGGLSAVYTAQPWQTQAIGSLIAGGYGVVGTHRAIPDISMDADGNTGIYIVFNNKTAGYGGTSLATPLFAAEVALANEARRDNRLPPVGLITQYLYSLPTSAIYGQAPITSVTIPTILNSSLKLTAQTGWGDIAGLGSVYTPLFVKDLLNYR